jgi:hypothetical protein
MPDIEIMKFRQNHWSLLHTYLGINLDGGLAAAEGNVHACALEGHQEGERLHLVR